MKKRLLGKSGMEVSEIALGTWQVGGKWGSNFDNANADRIIKSAIACGVNFIDTADVYSDGDSEKAVGKAVLESPEKIFVASKCGRQINPHASEGYTPAVLRRYVEDSLKRTGLERLDLIQLHCPPTQVYYRPEIFGLFDDLKKEGKIANLGVSVEKIEEAIKAMEFDNVTTVQIIFNIFRQRPAGLFFDLAGQKNVGVIVRVPLASGLLSGKFGKTTAFAPGDHRNFNREGQAFDKGETFSGVPYETGLEAVEEIRAVFPADASLAALALRWVLMFDAVSTVIPGASHPEQVEANCAAASLPPLTSAQMDALGKIYDRKIKPHVHQLW
ncbi:MAG: aldo/keto reductase [Spirochaetales bacterium]|nr:aldo/keto reductase [Spirochaetales bacterium]